MIRAPKTYDLVDEARRRQPPAWYVIPGGAETFFAYSDHGVALLLPESTENPNVITMDGDKTALLFKRAVSPVVFDLLVEFYENHGIFPELAVSHQPSGVAFDHIFRYKEDMKRRGLQWGLKNRGLPLLKAPWFLTDARMGNSSSATTLIALAEAFKKGMITDKPFNITSFGIGMAVASMVIQFNGR